MFVPTSAPHSGTTERTGAAYELRELNEGTAGLAVYTSPDKLLQVLGAEQNYVEVEIIELLRQVAGRVPVVVDPALRSAIG
ncbi:SseB family protein [Spirillospora sp. NPDC127506]